MTFFNFLLEYGGIIFATAGIALVVALPGIGSGKGAGMIGEAAAGLMVEGGEKFGKSLILQLMAASQGLYGFVVAIMALGNLNVDMSLQQGLFMFAATLPMTLVGYFSAISQSEVATAGITLLAKNEGEFTKAIIYSVMVETYALLALVTSIILLNTVAM